MASVQEWPVLAATSSVRAAKQAAEELRERLFTNAPLAVFEYALDALQQGGKIAARDRVALSSHQLVLSDEDARARAAIIRVLDQSGLTPPDQASLATLRRYTEQG